MSTQVMSCPFCGSTALSSDEEAIIRYPVRMLRNEVGQIYPDYTGDDYEVFDEGTTFDNAIQCRDCGQFDMTTDHLIAVTA